MKTATKEEIRRLVLRLVPSLDAQIPLYVVDTSEVDDELLAIFIEQMSMDIEGLDQAIERDEPDAAARAAHSIKGMGGTIGLPELSVLAAETENAARGTDRERFHDLARALSEVFARVKTDYESGQDV